MKDISVLFAHECESFQEDASPPECLQDLNLDQVFSKITKNKEVYRLNPLFYTLLEDVESVIYRQEVFKDLESETLTSAMNQFAERMVIVRRYLSSLSKLRYEYNIKGWHLESVLEYCSAISDLAQSLENHQLNSQGLRNFRKELLKIVRSAEFVKLHNQACEVKNKLNSIEYSIIIKDRWVRVRKYQGEEDYSKKILSVFNRFKKGDDKDYRLNLAFNSGMNHIDAQILECVINLYPEDFKGLKEFYDNNKYFIHPTVKKFDREIQFYLAYNLFIDRIKQFGLSFSYPSISCDEKREFINDAFDIALADKYRFTDLEVVCNDYFLDGNERIIIVSGPNQGGKTTFARMVGQLHYLSSLGCPIPGSRSKLLLVDSVFTHFEQEENFQKLRGKLKDELINLQQIIDQSTKRSLIVLNEILTSTSLIDATYLSTKIIEKIIQKDALCVCVSFIDELSTLSEKTVSMVSLTEPDDPTLRTFKIIRKPADGRAFAIHIAKKHGLTYESILEKIR